MPLAPHEGRELVDAGSFFDRLAKRFIDHQQLEHPGLVHVPESVALIADLNFITFLVDHSRLEHKRLIQMANSTLGNPELLQERWVGDKWDSTFVAEFSDQSHADHRLEEIDCLVDIGLEQ